MERQVTIKAASDTPVKANWFLCIMLAGLFLLANIDRFILNLMVESIKRDFGLSDTAVSLLIGLAFSLFYVLCGLPIARLADRSNRRNILTIGVLCWSAMTAFAGLAQSFWHLFLSRVGVGIGEATIAPCSHSMMADSLPPEKLSLGFSIYVMGSVLGAAMAYVLGAPLLAWCTATFPDGLSVPVVGHIFNWQLVFIILGVPGIVAATLFFFTVQEPARSQHSQNGDKSSIKHVAAYLTQHKNLFAGIYGGLAVLHVGAGALAAWLPALYERKFGLSPDASAPLLLTGIIIPGVASAFVAGWLGGALLKRGIHDSHVRISVIAPLIGFLPMGLAPLAPTAWLVTVFTGLGYFFVFMPVILCPAAIQLISPRDMRSTMASLVVVATILLGYGSGPTVVALITDYVFTNEAALDQSMAAVQTVSYGLCAAFFFIACRPFGAQMSLKA